MIMLATFEVTSSPSSAISGPENSSTSHADPFPDVPVELPALMTSEELQSYFGNDVFDFDMTGGFSTSDPNTPYVPNMNVGFEGASSLDLETPFQGFEFIGSAYNSSNTSETSLVPPTTLVHQSSTASSGWTSISGFCTPVEGEDEDGIVVEEQESDDLLVVSHGKRKRGPLGAQDREDAAKTRQMKACVRCRAQKIRCRYDEADPEGPCKPCKALQGKPTIHRIPCLRYKLIEFAVYRPWQTGYTARWQKLEMRNVTQWASPEIRHFTIRASVFPSYKITVKHRAFIPIEGDKMERKWVDGKQKKAIKIPPWAILDMDEAARDFRKIIDEKAFEHIDEYLELKHADELVKTVYYMAKQHLKRAQVEEERILLSNLLRMWFAIMITTETAWLEGPDTEDLRPVESSYPLAPGRVLRPPVSIEQWDFLVTLRIIIPLRKKVLDDLQRFLLSNKPQSITAVFLCTFVLLHLCSMWSADRYRHAMKHDSPIRFTLPKFIEEIHHGANILLAHFHYYMGDIELTTVDWKQRHKTRLAHLSTHEVGFYYHIVELLKEKPRVRAIKTAQDLRLYEDELYFVSQMFEKDWKPGDGYTCEVANADLWL